MKKKKEKKTEESNLKKCCNCYEKDESPFNNEHLCDSCNQLLNPTPLDIIWTKEQLEQQRDIILDEYDYHSTMKYCDAIKQEMDYIKIIDYPNARTMKKELKKYIDSFIESYIESDGDCSYAWYNHKWKIYMSYSWDGVHPLLEAAFVYQFGVEGSCDRDFLDTVKPEDMRIKKKEKR